MAFESLYGDHIQEVLSFLKYDYKTLRNMSLLSKKHNKTIKDSFKIAWFTLDKIIIWGSYEKFAVLRFEQINSYREKQHILYHFADKEKMYFWENVEYTYPGERSVVDKIKKIHDPYNIIKSEVKSLF
jgi:hypothetical protein